MKTLRKALGIIPARYHSSRLPGKPLASILGKPMIQWVHEGVQKARLLDRVVIATDDERIFRAAKDFGADVLMTSAGHKSGTERAAEVASGFENPIIINIQGDEPLIQGESIDLLVRNLQDPGIPMASLMARIYDISRIQNLNIVKVVVDEKGDALYFSRSPLPYGAADYFFQHIGVYGYQRGFLLKFAGLPPSRLEKSEKLEQLRALENGFPIKMIEMAAPTWSVDTPQDIIKVEDILAKKKNDAH